MTSSLVGSEMCIRDRCGPAEPVDCSDAITAASSGCSGVPAAPREQSIRGGQCDNPVERND
eukprot:8879431-Prorocentrum_lima.AAC.1